VDVELKGVTVIHKAFGRGIVIACDKSYLTVRFEQAEKLFQYPDAFKSFLVLEDKIIMDEMKTLLKIREKDVFVHKPKKTTKPAVMPQIEIEKPPILTPVKKKKLALHNIAFKCNFCDGGASDKSIGYHGVCSDDLIQNNVKTEKRAWCSADDCACRRYLEEEITRPELDAMYDDHDPGFVCYESQLLRDWKAFTGITLTGENKGKPMKLKEVKTNSLAVLTTRKPDTSEEERFIFAVFLVDQTNGGDLREEGYITANSNFRIALAPPEASKMLFWKYYSNIGKPDNILFGTGLHKYLSDEQAAQILKDIIDVKTNINEKNLAISFLDHFCYIKGIDKENIAPPTGALAK
jgi:hypothetical protein